MDNKEFKKALDNLVNEKGISKEYILEALELALTSAYKKNYHSLSNVRVAIDDDCNIKVYSFKTVVLDHDHAVSLDEEDKMYENDTLDGITSFADLENMEFDDEEEDEYKPFVFDDRIHITLEDAQKIVPGIKVGETIEEEVTPKDFGRVAASTAKQVVIQKIREAERNIIAEEFEEKKDEMVSGTVEMEDEKNYYINLGKTQGLLPKSEIIPGETIKMGSNIKVYINKVDINNKGALILLTRKHFGFVKRLFELEIPEISEGIVMVYGVAREPGVRTKIAVYSENSNVDPIGACIGEKGSRINAILNELGGEKIDIVLYDNDPAKFIANALAPAKDVHVYIIDEKEKEVLAVVDDNNLSLAIGKKGVNVRLATRLTHYKLDVKTFDQVKEAGINIL
ncbi:MAG: transcription termination/antitermination protein NusA [Bacilli bacterium]|nr:transcription termination/antitermination protein NusA [Bacilli bacterium]